ncbi:unnamed protein product [Prunus armeniaca]
MNIRPTVPSTCPIPSPSLIQKTSSSPSDVVLQQVLKVGAVAQNLATEALAKKGIYMYLATLLPYATTTLLRTTMTLALGTDVAKLPSGLFQFEMVLELWYSNHLYSCSYGFFVEQGEFTFSPNINIDECKSEACESDERCVNLPGSFSCLPCFFGMKGTSCNHMPKIWAAIGVMLVLLVGSAWSLCWVMKQRKYIKLNEKYFEVNGGFLLQHKLASHNGVETTRIFTAEELEKATNNYHDSRVLGKGSFEIVYKGILPDKKMVAIKKSRIAAPTQTEQFVNELVVLSQINHRNVVRLLGCCLESEVALLVYEFITNGTLFEHIHGERSRGSSLVWELQLKIAAETAGALAYLHSSTFMQIIQRDVKAVNILLDDNYTTKVSDFGASVLIPLHQTQVITLVQGTLGY